jgi:hypothetical protein
MPGKVSTLKFHLLLPYLIHLLHQLQKLPVSLKAWELVLASCIVSGFFLSNGIVCMFSLFPSLEFPESLNVWLWVSPRIVVLSLEVCSLLSHGVFFMISSIDFL